ncbi:GlsB/YeaQ/YmgE family stress response membrane protein [candidate division KSB1 bacterium]|nr:GlsB/YeaQ/YmgE family stress response membrane protein [candidate division KSB1 bacterium]
MSVFGLLTYLGIAAVAGYIGSHLAGYSTSGCFTNVVLGLIGAIIGTIISRYVNIRDPLYIAGIPLIWSIVGATLFVMLLGYFRRGSKKRR